MIWLILSKALIVGVTLSILLSVMSYFVVMRKMTFAGVGVAHSIFGGIAINFILGIASIFIPVGFAVLASLIMAFMYRKGGLTEDSAIDIIFVFSMAFGVFVLSLSSGYSANLLGILFGNILSVTFTDVYLAVAIFVVGVFLVSYFFSDLHLITYNEELAAVAGVKTEFLYYIFWALLGVTIVLSVKLIGIILVNAFLVLPTLVGSNLCRGYKCIIGSGVVSSVLSIWAGTGISYFFNVPTGSSIVLVLIGLWVISVGFRYFKKVGISDLH